MGAVAKVVEDRMVVKRRKIQKSGSSYYVSIPKEFISRWKLEKGEEVAVVAKGDEVRVIAMKGGITE